MTANSSACRVGCLHNDDGHVVLVGALRRAPAPLAGNDLECIRIAGGFAHNDRLDDAVLADRVRRVRQARYRKTHGAGCADLASSFRSARGVACAMNLPTRFLRRHRRSAMQGRVPVANDPPSPPLLHFSTRVPRYDCHLPLVISCAGLPRIPLGFAPSCNPYRMAGTSPAMTDEDLQLAFSALSRWMISVARRK